MKHLTSIIFVGFTVYSSFSQTEFSPNEDLPINHFQVIISHNSYRPKPVEKPFKKLNRFPLKSKGKQLDYYHEPLTVQLDSFNLKGLEIDIYHDPKGGRYYKRKEGLFFGKQKESHIKELQKPGLKVIHIPGIDYNTYHYTFKSSLKEIKDYSDNNPNHFPLFIMIEAKSKSLGNVFPLMLFGHKKALKFDKEALDNIDTEIKEVFKESADKIMIPDSIRGNYKTLRESITQKGWPSLKELRGKIFFICLMNSKSKEKYIENHFSLANRMMFIYTDENSPEAAFIKIDNPIKNEAKIKTLVKKGFIIRTRSDVGTRQARNGDYSRFNTSKSSGAQIISTDYYKPDFRYKKNKNWSGFNVRFTNKEKTVKLNPLFIHE